MGRLPDERPNYDYFAKLLATEAMVGVRPKTAWIFVSTTDLRLGLGEGTPAGYGHIGNKPGKVKLPHLIKNQDIDEQATRCLNGNVLLHEYTRSIGQKESTTVKDVSQDWRTTFEALYEGFEESMQANDCDIIEMAVTLELASSFPFPSSSQLNAFVELDITLRSLQNHRWKCVTRLVRPRELCGENETTLLEHTSEVGVQYAHRPDCRDDGSCDCVNRPRQDVRVPFPAAEWASILASCAGHDAEGNSKSDTRTRKSKRLRGPNVKSDLGPTPKLDEDGSELPIDGREPTNGELLLEQVAMIQELWSSPPHIKSQSGWRRRCVLMWRFQAVYQGFNKRGEPIKLPTGTTWRFLTMDDPTSELHQSLATVTTNAVSKGSVISPTSQYQHHIAASMSEDFNSEWGAGISLPGQIPRLSSSGSSLSVMSFAPSIVTHPPTASFHSSFDHSQSNPVTYITAVSPSCNTPPLDSPTSLLTTVCSAPGAEPFLSVPTSLPVSTYGNVSIYNVPRGDDSDCDLGYKNWDSGPSLQGLDYWNSGHVAYSQPDSWIGPQGMKLTPWTNQFDSQVVKSSHWSDQVGSQGVKSSHWPNQYRDASKANHELWTDRAFQGWPSHQYWAPGPAAAGADGRSWELESPSKVLELDAGIEGGRPMEAHLTPQHRGVKRGRSNSLNIENRENCPFSPIRKLVHQSSTSIGDEM
jgi:transcriptional enhancer factor